MDEDWRTPYPMDLVHVTGNPWVILGPHPTRTKSIPVLTGPGLYGWGYGYWHHITSHRHRHGNHTSYLPLPMTTIWPHHNNVTRRNKHHSRMRGDGLSCLSPIIGIFNYIHIFLLYWLIPNLCRHNDVTRRGKLSSSRQTPFSTSGTIQPPTSPPLLEMRDGGVLCLHTHTTPPLPRSKRETEGGVNTIFNTAGTIQPPHIPSLARNARRSDGGGVYFPPVDHHYSPARNEQQTALTPTTTTPLLKRTHRKAIHTHHHHFPAWNKQQTAFTPTTTTPLHGWNPKRKHLCLILGFQLLLWSGAPCAHYFWTGAIHRKKIF